MSVHNKKKSTVVKSISINQVVDAYKQMVVLKKRNRSQEYAAACAKFVNLSDLYAEQKQTDDKTSGKQ